MPLLTTVKWFEVLYNAYCADQHGQTIETRLKSEVQETVLILGNRSAVYLPLRGPKVC